MKTLADFKQEVAERYGHKWCSHLKLKEPPLLIDKYNDEVAELYAEYKAKESWNEALHWAAENIKPIYQFPNVTDKIKQSILKGLKP